MKIIAYASLFLSLGVLFSCNNPQESNSRELTAWLLGPESLIAFYPATEGPGYGVTISGSSCEYHCFLTSDGENLWSLGLVNGLTNTLDTLSDIGEVTEYSLPIELTQVVPGGLCFKEDKFWMAVETGTGVQIWRMNHNLSLPQMLFVPTLPPVQQGNPIAKGIDVDLEENVIWLGLYGYFGAQPSLKLLKYNFNTGALLDEATVVQGYINGGDIASGDQCIWVTVYYMENLQTIGHYNVFRIDKQSLQTVQTIDALAGEFGIALQ
jgi:outer membrane protein assembly factor BamB